MTVYLAAVLVWISLVVADGSAYGQRISQPEPSAQVLKSVAVRQEPMRVMTLIEGDGSLRYEVTRLEDGNRLVVDLLGVTSEISKPTIPVGHPLLQQIRIGRHDDPKMTRVVYDMEGNVQYSVVPIGRKLVVTLHAVPPSARTDVTPLSLPQPVAEPTPPPPPPVVEPPPPPVVEPSLSSQPEGAQSNLPQPGEQLPATTQQAKSPSGSETLLAQAGVTQEASRAGKSEPSPVKPPGKTSHAPSAGFVAEGRVSGESEAPKYAGRRISLDFQAADLRNVLRMIAEVSERNMVVGESVQGKVAIRLLNVPWDQALDVVMRMHALGKIEWGQVIFIDTAAKISQQAEAQLREQEIAKRAKESELAVKELITELVPVNYANLDEVESIIKDQLSVRGEIKKDTRTNHLIIRDVDEKVHELSDLIRSLDRRTPQVLVEARIVTANRDFARSLGIQWGVSHTVADPTNPFTVQTVGTGGAFGQQASDFLVNLPASVAGPPTLGFTYGKLLGDLFTLDMRLSAGESLNLANVVSSPKIVTLDNKPAKIEQGTQVPFETTSLQGTQTTFIDANLVLNVTPHVVLHDQTISLKVQAAKNSVGTLTFDAGPTIDTNEAETEVLVKNGETVVIGGILEETKTDTSTGIPYLSKIPVLGWLFKNKSITLRKTELLIFLTPSILE